MSSFSERAATVESSLLQFFSLAAKNCRGATGRQVNSSCCDANGENGPGTKRVQVWKLTPSVFPRRIETMRCWLAHEICVTSTRQKY
jgi:hypothetical protein